MYKFIYEAARKNVKYEVILYLIRKRRKSVNCYMRLFLEKTCYVWKSF